MEKIKETPTGFKNFRDAALFWFKFGFKVIPIVPGSKRTAVKWDPWLDELTSEEIVNHWRAHPEHELGFIIDESVIVFDADSPESIAALAELEQKLGVAPNLVVKTTKGVHHYFRRAKDAFAKTDSHSTDEFPHRIDVKASRSMVVLPPSTGKIILIEKALNANELTEVTQIFIDAVFQHNGRMPPRKSDIAPSQNVLLDSQDQNLAKLKELLERLDPDLGYQDWLHVLMAIYHETGGSEQGFELANEWSLKGQKYKGTAELKTKWFSFKSAQNKPITIATIIKLVADNDKNCKAICDAVGPQFKDLGKETKIISPSVKFEAEVSKSGEESIDLLERIQQQYCLISINGRLWVLDRSTLKIRSEHGTAAKLSLSNRSDGALFLTRTAKALSPQVDASKIVKEFFVSPNTTCFDRVEFNPAGTSANVLNLWVGPTITPQPGEWKLIAAYLLEVICDRDQVSYAYLLKFIAHALQKPEEKPGILVILLGGQGIGKGTLARILKRIWSSTFLQIHNIASVTGSFNAALECNFIVFMDEALFVGDRRASDALKSLVTEPVIHINEKHQPARQMQSFHRFFAATNAEHFKNTERDDRRDFVLRVSESRMNDHVYWKALNSEIENGGIEAIVHDLLAIELQDFNVRAKPSTQALIDQKLQSLDPIPRWWHNSLIDGEFSEDGKWPDFIRTSTIINEVLEMAGGKIFRKPTPIDVARAMGKLCPSASQKQQQNGYDRARGYSLPPLAQARAEFEVYIGGKIDW